MVRQECYALGEVTMPRASRRWMGEGQGQAAVAEKLILVDHVFGVASWIRQMDSFEVCDGSPASKLFSEG